MNPLVEKRWQGIEDCPVIAGPSVDFCLHGSIRQRPNNRRLRQFQALVERRCNAAPDKASFGTDLVAVPYQIFSFFDLVDVVHR
jgi:hypothetical protein